MIFALATAWLLSAAPGGTLTLDQALAEARAHQPTLRQADAQADAARARADEAFAPNLPQVNLGASYRISTTNRGGTVVSNGSGGVTQVPTTAQTYAAGLTVQQTLWDFQQTWGRTQAARSSAEAQADTARAQAITVALAVRAAYFAARAQKDLVQVAQATLTNQQAHLRQTQGFVEVGTQPEIALAQSRANVANAKVQLITAQNNYAAAKAKLNQAMGREGPTDYDVVDTALPPVPGEAGPLKALVDQAWRARPEAAAYDAELDAQAHTLTSIRGGYWPSLGASLGATLEGPEPAELAPNVSGQLSLSWNLFSGGQTRAQVREAQAQQVVLQAQRDAFHQQLWLDVEQAQLAVHAAQQTVIAAADALAAAQAQLTLAEGRYQAGVGSIIELSDAQAQLTQASAQQVSATYTLATARAQLLAALGTP